MSQLRLNSFVHEQVEDMVAVTGLPRSGTTILGRLVGSLSPLEYAFEPPMVAYLDANCRHELIDSETAVELLQVYLYYDYFAEYLHGRAYNFRPDDASYILGMQTVPEIHRKWKRVGSMSEAIAEGSNRRFSFKFPGAYHVLSTYFEAFPAIQIVDIGRNLDRVLASLVDKRWFFDENLGPDATGLWPFLDVDGEYMVPYLVDESDVDAWQSMNAETRTVYICNRLAEDRLAFQREYGNSDNYHVLRYEDLVEDPQGVTDTLTSALGVERGQMTQSVIDDIEPTTAPSDVDAILETCEDAIEDRFLQLRPRLES